MSARTIRRTRIRALGGLAAATVVTLVAAGCATGLGALGSDVGDKLLDEPPYYTGRLPAGAEPSFVHLPVTYQRGGSQDAIFDPTGGPGTPIAALLREMNQHLERLGFSEPIEMPVAARQTAPDVSFGCEPGPLGECVAESHDIALAGSPWLKLAVGKPSRQWTAAIQHALDESGADYLLVITLEVGRYWPNQKNLRGQKEIRLGTGYAAAVPWLTSLDRPVQVLQLTGALVDREGRVLRIGAEGLLARPTNLLASAVGATSLIGGSEVERLRQARRDDLPGSPAVWQVGLESLVTGLTGRRPGPNSASPASSQPTRPNRSRF